MSFLAYPLVSVIKLIFRDFIFLLFKQEAIRDDSGTMKTVKDVGVDSSLSPIGSPNPTIDFEKKQQQIIDLWHECNVSIVHRTYFFLLFKGDPSDSIYMEVEHRRLSFIKSSFSAQPTAEGELNSAIASR
jgi:centromeric protein E